MAFMSSSGGRNARTWWHTIRHFVVGAGIEGLTRGYWFLAKADVSEDMRRKIVSASEGSYEYMKSSRTRWRLSVRQSVAQMDKEADPSRLWKGRGFDHRVNMVGGFGEDESDNEAIAIEAKVQDEMALVEAMEQEASVLMTQVAKRRSMVERTRGFQKTESGEEREPKGSTI